MSEYQQAHLEIDRITEEERRWLEPYFDDDWWKNNHPEEMRGFDMRYDVHGQLMLWSDDHLYVDNLSWFLRQFLAAHRPKAHIIFEYCWHGDSGYGGGACLVTAKTEVHFNPWDMARQWHEKGVCEPTVEEYKDAVDNLEDAVNEGLRPGDGDGG